MLARSSRSPFDTRYIIISNFLEIALLVLISITILNLIKHNPSKKKVLQTMFVVFLVAQMGLLGTGYYNGWNLAEERHIEMQSTLSCGKLPTDWESCESLIDQGDYDWNRISILINFVIEHKLNLLSDNSFNQENSKDIEIFNFESENKNQILGLGEIDFINKKQDSSIVIKSNEPLITISGWIKGKDNEKINDVFLLIDEKPFVKVSASKLDLENSQKRLWSTSFFAGYLEEGCHNIHAAGISTDSIIVLKDRKELCV